MGPEMRRSYMMLRAAQHSATKPCYFRQLCTARMCSLTGTRHMDHMLFQRDVSSVRYCTSKSHPEGQASSKDAGSPSSAGESIDEPSSGKRRLLPPLSDKKKKALLWVCLGIATGVTSIL